MLIRSHFTHDDNAMVNMVNSLPPEAYFLECDGSVHEELGTIQKGKLIQLHFRLCGGKGGFLVFIFSCFDGVGLWLPLYDAFRHAY